ncbi:hypothetical protein [Limibacillus halophilus]
MSADGVEAGAWVLGPGESRILEDHLSARERKRVKAVELRGHKLWVKRYGVELFHPGRLLHWFFSPIIYPRFLKSSRMLTRRGMVERELRKLTAFRRAGLLTPEVVYDAANGLVVTDLTESAKERLQRFSREGDIAGHEDLLVALSRELGRVHAAGLCHGRPLTRDALCHEGRLGFVDFEEEPEEVMPLAAAQARDAWLQLLETMALAKRPETPELCFAAYRAEAPKSALEGLRPILRFFGAFLPLARGSQKVFRLVTGGYVPRDLIRFERTIEFLRGKMGRP